MNHIEIRSVTSPCNNVHKKCRCCLEEGQHPHIINEEHMHTFKETFNLLLTCDPQLAQFMCSSCVHSLMEGKRFRDMVLATETQMLQALKTGTYYDSDGETEIKSEILEYQDILTVEPTVVAMGQACSPTHENKMAVPAPHKSQLEDKTESARKRKKCNPSVQTDKKSDSISDDTQEKSDDSNKDGTVSNEDVVHISISDDEKDLDEDESEGNLIVQTKKSKATSRNTSQPRRSGRVSKKTKVFRVSPFKNQFDKKTRSVKRKKPNPPVQSDVVTNKVEVTNKQNYSRVLTIDSKGMLKNTALVSEYNSTHNPRPTGKQPSELAQRRRSIIKILKNSTIIPFQYSTLHHPYNYGCYYCDNVCLKLDELRDHTEHKHQWIREKDILSFMQRRAHKFISADISNIECKICKKKLQTLEALLDHLSYFHSVLSYKADKTCILGFNSKSKTQRCPVCEEEFNSFLLLLMHMNGHYDSVCKHCGISCSSARELIKHLQTHLTVTFESPESSSLNKQKLSETHTNEIQMHMLNVNGMYNRFVKIGKFTQK